MAQLVVKSGKEAGQSLDLTRATILGRGENVQLRISDVKASREHCRVFEQAGTWVVADLNSRNGITVNGVKTTRKNLRHGDVIAIGLTQVAFEGGPASGSKHKDTGEVFPERKRSAPAKKGGAASAKEKAFAAARADAAKGGAKRSAKPAAKRGGGDGGGGDEGTQISDRVLQFSKVDTRKAGMMDYDISQMSGTARFLITLAGIAILALAVWGVSLAVG